GSKAMVMVGLEIASFTYGGLLGLFLLSKSKRNFHTASLATGLVASMAIVFVLKHFGLAWSWFILVSVSLNVVVVYLTDMVLRKISPDKG
ncbi:MAG: sodium:solute symporter, partial [Chlorobium sp.]|nr:sodium:solute symporter [Chlorobium sp.]